MKRNTDPTLPWQWKKPLLLGAGLRGERGLLPRIPGTLSSNEQFVSHPLNHCSDLKCYPVESLGRKSVAEAELMFGVIVILTHALGVFQTVLEGTIEREYVRAESVKKITHLIECLLLDPNTVFPQCLPPSPSPDGNEGFKNKILSSNCSLPEDVCWTIFSSLSQTFGILQAGREKPPGTTFLKGPLSLPCSPELLQLPPLDAAHLWAVEKEYWPSAFKSCQKSWSLPTTATEHL